MILVLLAACANGTPDGACDTDAAAGASTGTDDTPADTGDTIATDPCAWVDEGVEDQAFANYSPVVLCTSPTAGAVDVDPGTPELRVSFSKDMNDDSWSWVQVSDRAYPETTGDPHYVSDRTIVLPVALEPDHTYVVWLNYDPYLNFRDIDGNSAVPYQLTFRTGEARR